MGETILSRQKEESVRVDEEASPETSHIPSNVEVLIIFLVASGLFGKSRERTRVKKETSIIEPRTKKRVSGGKDDHFMHGP
jgi:hypothetical protein